MTESRRVLVTEDYLEDIADSIRAKLGVQTEYTPAQMSDAIDDIETGGGGATVTELNVTANGTYTAPTGTAYSPVNVNVSGGSTIISSTTFTENGTYRASSYSADGFGTVVVNVPQSSGGLSATATSSLELQEWLDKYGFESSVTAELSS